ncbi:serine protease [Stigmatella sp. ncwal1]|uniref:Serine protease n=1 Tax=Stigmatella ashevillensis TaxID=2995309 RepID=A0ABT5DNT3_9BACT|nr:serine protease [Stigmatella ashevillena]MDC0715191.1 serine protease [Stigmatella ashevillena]
MMPRLLVLILGFSLAAHASNAGRPTRADMQRVMELHARSVVRVHGPRRAGPGVIVGSQGQVLTSVEHVSLEAAEVEFGGQRLVGAVVLAHAALKIAVVAAPRGSYPSVPVKVLPEGLDGQWLIGVVAGRRKQDARPFTAVARHANAPFVDLDLPLAPGSPLFDSEGRLVAVVVQLRPGGCRALPLASIQRQLAPPAVTP